MSHPATRLSFHGRSIARLTLVGLGIGILLAAPAGAAGSFDGTYRGSQRILRTNNSSECNNLNSDKMLLNIQDNHFTRRWYTAELGIDVAPDGSFHQSASFNAGRRVTTAKIDGKITGGSFEADLGTDTCAVHLSLTKS
jgi:hypothetical protein